MSLRVIDADETARMLPWRGLIEALRDMLGRRRAGRALAPERLAMPIAGGMLLAMPATDGEYVSTKLVTLCGGNPCRGLPNLLGDVVLMRADTGERLAVLDAPALTARRTAALSALAAIALGRSGPDAPRRMLIVGSGVQARAHLEVFTEALGVERVAVCSRDPERARSFAQAARGNGIDCRAIADPTEGLAQADIVVTATTSHSPVFDDDPAFRGFVAAVGAFRPEMCELPAALLARARLYIDDKPGGRHEAGDFIQAGVDWKRVTALEDALARGGKPPEGPVVFKSVGQALWDLAACRLAARSLAM